jgi:hypothetical protein
MWLAEGKLLRAFGKFCQVQLLSSVTDSRHFGLSLTSGQTEVLSGYEYAKEEMR